MFRTLIIVAAIVLVFLLVKNRLGRKPAARSKKTMDSSNTVQCLQCHTYVPVDEAVSSNDRHFCCRQHQRDWQENQSRED